MESRGVARSSEGLVNVAWVVLHRKSPKLELGNGDSWYHMCAFRFHFWGRKVIEIGFPCAGLLCSAVRMLCTQGFGPMWGSVLHHVAGVVQVLFFPNWGIRSRLIRNPPLDTIRAACAHFLGPCCFLPSCPLLPSLRLLPLAAAGLRLLSPFSSLF